MSDIVIKFEKCQSATKKGKGPQCRNKASKRDPEDPTLQDRCTIHEYNFDSYRGNDANRKFERTSASRPTTPNAPEPGDPFLNGHVPEEPPIFNNPRNRKSGFRRRDRSASWGPEGRFGAGYRDANDDTADVPDYGHPRQPPGPGYVHRPDMDYNPRHDPSHTCDPTVSEYEIALREQPRQMHQMVLGSNLVRAQRRHLNDIANPKQQIHYLKDHPKAGESQNSPNAIWNRTLAVMLERQSTHDAILMTLCDVLGKAFERLSELSDERDQGRAGRGRRASPSPSPGVRFAPDDTEVDEFLRQFRKL